MLTRHPANPLISPADVPASKPDWEVIGTFNAGACAFGDEIILLLRVAERPISTDDNIVLCPYYVDGELVVESVRKDDPDWVTSDPRGAQNPKKGVWRLTSISHIRLARSKDGVHFTVDAQPWIAPDDAFDGYGVEDARVTQIEDQYYINYTAVSPFGIATKLVTTSDFKGMEHLGMIFPPPNRDVTIFPQRINGEYVCYHRPMPSMGGLHIWSATSPDLRSWGNHQVVLTSKPGDWTGGRVGGGAPPVLIDAGWLSIYHAADKQDRYCLGAFITDRDDPTRVIKLYEDPIFVPDAPYETNGFFGKVVFTCGAVKRGNELLVYYGAADEHTALATVDLAAFS